MLFLKKCLYLILAYLLLHLEYVLFGMILAFSFSKNLYIHMLFRWASFSNYSKFTEMSFLYSYGTGGLRL